MSKFTCQTCDYSTDYKSNFNRHMKSARHLKKSGNAAVVQVKKVVKAAFTCDACNYSTTYKSNYTRHLKSARHLQKEEVRPTKIHQCPGCDYTSKSSSNVKRHVLSKHSIEVSKRDTMFSEISKYKGQIRRLQRMMTKKNESEIKDQMKPIVEKVNKLVRVFNGMEQKDEKPTVVTPMKEVKTNKSIDKNLLNEIKKKIKIFTDLELDVTDYIPIAENYENHTKDKLEELNSLLDDELSSDQTMIEYITEKGGDANKYYQYKYNV